MAHSRSQASSTLAGPVPVSAAQARMICPVKSITAAAAARRMAASTSVPGAPDMSWYRPGRDRANSR